MDQATIDRLRELNAKATEGTWERMQSVYIISAGNYDSDIAEFDWRSGDGTHEAEGAHNAELTVTMHNVLPDLLAYVDELQVRLQAAQGKLTQADDEIDRLRVENERVVSALEEAADLMETIECDTPCEETQQQARGYLKDIRAAINAPRKTYSIR